MILHVVGIVDGKLSEGDVSDNNVIGVIGLSGLFIAGVQNMSCGIELLGDLSGYGFKLHAGKIALGHHVPGHGSKEDSGAAGRLQYSASGKTGLFQYLENIPGNQGICIVGGESGSLCLVEFLIAQKLPEIFISDFIGL